MTNDDARAFLLSRATVDPDGTARISAPQPRRQAPVIDVDAEDRARLTLARLDSERQLRAAQETDARLRRDHLDHQIRAANAELRRLA